MVYDDRFLAMADNPALAAEFENWVASLPTEIKGIQGGAYWSNVEKEKDVYDHRLIDIQLEICKRHGKQLFCMIMEKQFGAEWSPAPAYISSDYQGVANMVTFKGKAARIWDPQVLERFCLLIDELGARYDGDAAFEGIEFMETPFNCDAEAEASRGFTVNDYIRSYQTLLTRAKAAFRDSVVIQEVNSLPATGAPGEMTIADFIAFCGGIGVGIGGPDLQSDKERNPQRRRISSYEYFPLYAGKIPLASDVQYPEYAGELWYGGQKTWFGNFTPQGLLDMGINTLKLNYIFWCAVEKKPETRFGFTRDVIPTLKRNNWPIHSGWPQGIGP